jgi:hypothetical protein
MLAAGLFGTPAYAAEAPAGAEATGQYPAQSQTMNWFDPSTWMTGGAYGGMQHGAGDFRWNPAHPAGWIVFMDPKAHPGAHWAFMNPATYAQFMQPQFYMQFADPSNWMAWINPASYMPLMNPATYMGWMNPAAYMHVVDPSMYMQAMNPGNYMAFINPLTYMQWLNPSAYAVPGLTTGGSTGGFNWFDPSAWGGYAQTQPQGQGQSQGFNPFDPSTWMAQPPAQGDATQQPEQKPAQ